MKIGSYRGKFYVILQKGSLLRWAAKQVSTGKDYSTLNTTIWRRAGNKEAPIGCDGIASPGSTYYFVSEEDASKAAELFVKQLEALGVKR